MSAQDRLADIIAEHQWYIPVTRGSSSACLGCLRGGESVALFESFNAYAKHLAKVIAQAHGIAVVELPEQMTDRGDVVEAIRDLPMWQQGDSWACAHQETDTIEFETSGPDVFVDIDAQAAVDIVSVLLAAVQNITDAVISHE